MIGTEMKKEASMTHSWFRPVAVGLLLPLTSVVYLGCKKDEPPPPLPSAAPATTPSAPLVLEVEDAAPPVEDADADADAKKVGTGTPASMKRCCAAVAQNAESAPEPTKSYMKTLAAACMAAAAGGKAWSGGGFSCK
jgi:hypothetical protein